MKKCFVLFVIFGAVTFLFSQRANEEPLLQADKQDPQSLDPQKFCSKFDAKRYEALSKAPFSVENFAFVASSGPVWHPIGPEGGYIKGMAFNPLNSQEIYVVLYKGAFYKSANSGQTWEKKAYSSYYSYDLAIDPSNSNIIYVLEGSGINKSLDGGATWQRFYFPSYCYASNGKIAINPQDPNVLYATGYHYYDTYNWKSSMAVFKSTNGGVNWTTIDLNPTKQYASGYCMAIDPSSPNILYTGGYEYDGSYYLGKVYKSTNGGANWSDITGSIQGYAYTIAIDPISPLKVYVGTYIGIYRSSDGGLTWSINNGYAYAYGLALDASMPSIIYAGAYNGCYKSVDGGINWISYTSGLSGSCNSLLVSSTAALFGSESGVYMSTNSGVSWQASNSGILATEIPTIAVAPSSPNNLYVEARYIKLMKSNDLGNSWIKLPTPDRCDMPSKLIVNPSNANDVFFLSGG